LKTQVGKVGSPPPLSEVNMSYDENRVRVKVYGSLPADSRLLVPVPTVSGKDVQRIHRLAAAALVPMSGHASRDLGVDILVASGWRPHRWRSRQQYEEVLVRRYGSVARGRRYLGFDSPHETGLAIDGGSGGLAPVSATIARQLETPLHRWLVEHAWEYGWHPYKAEPWHWEFPLDIDDYRVG
jgi:LAS superfamily LD-carboxypeptidase LdcB